MTPTTDQPPAPPVGRRIAVGNGHLFMHREGTGRPPVIVLPGAGAVALDYWTLHQAVSKLTTSILYDRAGTGWSDPAPLPRSAREVTDELRTLLQAMGEQPPYLFIGHSLGGGYARLYAQRFPGEVAGLLLLDPLHEDGNRLYPAEVVQTEDRVGQPIPDLPAPMLAAYRALFEQKLATVPAHIREPLIAHHGAAWRTGMREASNVNALYDELRHGGPLPTVPVIVMTAMALDPVQRQFMPEELLHRVNVAKRTMNLSVVASAPRGEHRELPDASHAWMCQEETEAITHAVADLLASIRAA